MSMGRLAQAARAGLVLAAAVIVSVGHGDPAAARPRAAVGYSHYPVSGTTALEMLKQMELHGPNVGGSDAYASTESTLRHTGSLVQGVTCRLKDYAIAIDFTIRLPAAQELDGMTQKVRGAWRTFYAFVKRHEETHKAIWLQCANRLEGRIRALRERSCEALDQKIGLLVDAEVAACQVKHAAFDRVERARLRAQPLVKQAFRQP